MEVCLHCKYCLFIKGMGGSAVCIKKYEKHGLYMAEWIVSPEYHSCGEWVIDDDSSSL